MDWLKVLLFVLAVAYKTLATPDFVTCKRTYKKIGCFKQSATISEVKLVNDRDPSSPYFQGHIINWHEFEKSLHSLACRCHDAAKKQGLKYFAIRYYGECVGGKDEKGLENLLQNERSKECANTKFLQCDNHVDGSECAGKGNAEYIYQLTSNDEKTDIDGGYSEWTDFSDCSLTCGVGVAARERTCTNPRPKGNGNDCDVLGSSTETKDCKKADCPIFSQWGTWSPCTQPCAGGIRTRTRKCSYPGGGACSDQTVASVCNVEKCEYCERQLEAGIILDRSGSVAYKDGKYNITNWHGTINFANRFLKAFSIDNNHVHYGVMRFSAEPVIDVNIRDSKYWHNDMIQKLLSSPAIYNLMPSGGTYMGKALLTAKNKWYCSGCGLRPGVPKVLILFTDGKPNGQNPITIAKKLKDMGVKIVTVGIGKGSDFDVLTKIASKPSYVFKLQGFDYMKEAINKMVKVVCSSAV